MPDLVVYLSLLTILTILFKVIIPGATLIRESLIGKMLYSLQIKNIIILIPDTAFL